MAIMLVKSECRKLSARLDALAAKLESDAVLTCGWHSDASPYEDRTPVASVAIWNEFGTRTAPPRPFVRPAIASNGDRWLLHLARGLRRVLNGDLPGVNAVLEALGEEIVKDLKESIMRVWSPPLSPRTVYGRIHSPNWNNAEKGGYQAALYKPLVDTAHMIESTAWRVKGGE